MMKTIVATTTAAASAGRRGSRAQASVLARRLPVVHTAITGRSQVDNDCAGGARHAGLADRNFAQLLHEEAAADAADPGNSTRGGGGGGRRRHRDTREQ